MIEFKNKNNDVQHALGVSHVLATVLSAFWELSHNNLIR